MSSHVEDFLTAVQEQEIVEAIRQAEKDTSGEIRVHLEGRSDSDPLERAKEVFSFLKMNETKERNGVLFYVAVDDRKFSILGDTGIDKKVPDDFWNSVKDTVIDDFKNGKYTEGLVKGIIETGKKLKAFFPYTSDDRNELDDSISKGSQ
ncbi:MAG: TPM domain-containing protein [Flavobacteriaceae bacterium]|nr:TPM domain-containing protein [Flavobacteriaceae bacterium]